MNQPDINIFHLLSYMSPLYSIYLHWKSQITTPDTSANWIETKNTCNFEILGVFMEGKDFYRGTEMV